MTIIRNEQCWMISRCWVWQWRWGYSS